MTKAQIIEQILQDLRALPPEDRDVVGDVDEEARIIAVLLSAFAKAQPDVEVRTCRDFQHLGIPCCESCHAPQYSHDELALIDLEGGGNAWICCAMELALNPVKRMQFEQSPEYRMLEEALGSGEAKRDK